MSKCLATLAIVQHAEDNDVNVVQFETDNQLQFNCRVSGDPQIGNMIL